MRQPPQAAISATLQRITAKRMHTSIWYENCTNLLYLLLLQATRENSRTYKCKSMQNGSTFSDEGYWYWTSPNYTKLLNTSTECIRKVKL